MYGWQEIYDACMVLKEDAKQVGDHKHTFSYTDPLSCGLEIGYDDNRFGYVAVFFGWIEVFRYGNNDDKLKVMKHGDWEGYLVSLANNKMSKSTKICAGLSVDSIMTLAEHNRRKMIRMRDALMVIVDEVGEMTRFSNERSSIFRVARSGYKYNESVDIHYTCYAEPRSYYLWTHVRTQGGYEDFFNFSWSDERIRNNSCRGSYTVDSPYIDFIFKWEDEILDSKEDYYAILGLQRNANLKQIKRAYHKMAKRWHPDANEDAERAQKMFQKISKAYSVLSDIDKRKHYDKYGHI